MKFEDIGKIWCLTTFDNKDRQEFMKDQFRRVGILEDVNFYINYRLSIFNDFGANVTNFQTKYYNAMAQHSPNLFGNVLSCTLGWYYIMKSSYEDGYDNIMCFEDDVEIFISLDEIKHICSKIPVDFDVAKFIWRSNKNSDALNYPEMININLLDFNINNDENLWNKRKEYDCNAWFVINRNGMKKWIDIMENSKLFTIGDRVLEYYDDINIYNINYRIGQLKNCKSTINESQYKIFWG